MKPVFIFVVLFSLPLFFACAYANQAENNPPVAITTNNPDIPLDELEDMLYPMTSDELLVEADGWLALLKETTVKISKAQLAIKRKNRLIEKKEEVTENTEKVKVEKKAEKAIDVATEEKLDILEDMNFLQEQRIEKTDRLSVVLNSITLKVGKTDKGKEPEIVLPYRQYIRAISGVQVDVTDIQAAWVSVYGWMVSGEGGIRWLVNLIKFVLLIVVFWFLSKVLSKGAERILNMSPSDSVIMNNFIISGVRRLTLLIGVLVGLSAMEVNVGPVLAIIGAAGFVVAFALQSTLSNFASGLMIMFYRPFDVGDLIDVTGGVYGTVESMTLVSTDVMTLDNKLMVVPNNQIWGNTIVNATKSSERRIDMVFGISYSDNIEHATQVITKVLKDHPKVLDDPPSVVKVDALADSSVNFVCRPWVNTPDYWDVYWDITRQVKESFDTEGISIPFPQRDVHIQQQS